MSAYPQGQPEEPLPEEAKRRGPAPRPIFAPVAREEMAVRWSPVFAGVLIGLGINIVLTILGLAFGLTAARPGAAISNSYIIGAAIWSGVSLFIALFVGGFLAGRLGTYLGLRRGVLQGTVTWAIYLLSWMWILTGSIGGALGLMSNPNVTATAARTVSGVNVAQVMTNAAGATWYLFGVIVVGWALAALGGWIGASMRSTESQTTA